MLAQARFHHLTRDIIAAAIEDFVVVEVKALAEVLPVHQAQVLTYLRLTDLPVGLVINFNVDRLVKGVKRNQPEMECGKVRLRCSVAPVKPFPP